MRSDALGRREGELIGREDELMARYGVSRPTVRQAARMLAQEQLIRVGRGPAGGYFADRPTIGVVTRMAALFLQAHGATYAQLNRASEAIRVELVRLAALDASSEARAAFNAFLEDEASRAELPAFDEYLLSEQDFTELLGRASGNTVLALFQRIVLDLVGCLAAEKNLTEGKPERIQELLDRRQRIVRAIVAGELESALSETRERAEVTEGWRQRDLQEEAARRRSNRTRVGPARRARRRA